jgi:hypothetical protein
VGLDEGMCSGCGLETANDDVDSRTAVLMTAISTMPTSKHRARRTMPRTCAAKERAGALEKSARVLNAGPACAGQRQLRGWGE